MFQKHQSFLAVTMTVLVCGGVAAQGQSEGLTRPAPNRADGKPAPPPIRPLQRPLARDGELRVPENVQVVRDVVFAEAPVDEGKIIELKMDTAFLKKSDGKPMPAIVYVHGGGWSKGSREVGLRPSIGLAQGGYFAATIDYRLSDEARYPAAVHDCKAAIRFLRANADELGIDPDRIGVWGHSAGGHLSALLGTTSNTNLLDGDIGKAPKNTSASVQCIVDFSGPIDLTVGDGPRESGPIALWLGGPVRNHMDLARQASPITYIDANDPPTLIVHGTKDPLVNIRQSELFAKALNDAGVVVEFLRVEGGGHAVSDPEAYQKTAAWFDKHLGGHAEGAVRELFQMFGQQQRRATKEDSMPRPRRPVADGASGAPASPSEQAHPQAAPGER